MELPRLFVAPANLPPDTRHNWKATQKEGVAFGPMDAAGSFLPVLLARLGASNVQVGLLSAIPNLAGFLLAIPVGHFLQGRRNIVPWYSRGRFVNQLVIPAIGISLLLLPPEQVVPVIIVLVGLSAVVGSFANFSFYTVMDGLSGPNGRYELMSRRWAMKGAATAISLAVIGWILANLAFPHSYELVYIATGVAAVVGFSFARTFRIPDQVRRPAPEVRPSPRARASTSVREIAGERRFLAFLGRHSMLSLGLSMAVPLIPLYYVRQLGASDAWIGLIGTTQAVMTMSGYVLWRRMARRRGGGALVLVVSTIGVAVFPAVLAFTRAELAVAVFVAGYGVCLAGIELTIFDELMRAVPPGEATRFAALDQGATSFGGIVGPIAGALVAGALGIPAGLVVAALVTLVGAAMFAMSVLSRRRAVARGAGDGALPAADEPLRAGDGALPAEPSDTIAAAGSTKAS